MPLSGSQAEEFRDIFALFDDEGDGKIDGTQLSTIVRAWGVKPTQEAVLKAIGKEYKKGEKRLTFEEAVPVYEQLAKEKEAGSYADFMEGLKVFDKDDCGKILGAELRHILLALGERLTMEEVDEVMDGVEDGEGLVNYDSFVKKMMQGPFPVVEEK